MTNPSPPPPNLDPPFRGYIETTFDALLVFEAARRGMIPRVTRRLIERERGMVQSGAVFVFDEHESGIKRWTDGLVWSPSRILGNFLVYRETDKRANPPPTPMSTNAASSSPNRTSPSGTAVPPNRYDPTQMVATPPQYAGGETIPPLGQGALQRNRSASEGGSMSRHRERQLVGSLTNSYKFKEGGLVKKTMSVTVNGFAQHMISYYSIEDVLAGKLRCPSTIPELASLEISPEYLHKQNFRFPPMIEVGADGIPRYRGEPEEPTSPQSPMSNLSMHSFPPGDVYDPYGTPAQMRIDSPRTRSVTVPMPIPMSPPTANQHQYASSAGSTFFEHPMLPPGARPDSSGSMQSGASASTGAMRPQSSSRRYEAYGAPPTSSPRPSTGHVQDPHRRTSQGPPQQQQGMYYNQSGYDVKPAIGGGYHYQPPSTAPGAFADFYAQSAPAAPGHISNYQGQGYSWQPQPGQAGAGPSQPGQQGTTSRLIPSHPAPPSTSAGAQPGAPPSGEYSTSSHPPPPGTASGPPGGNWQSNGHAHVSPGWVAHNAPPAASGQHGAGGAYVGQVGDDWRQSQSLAS